MRKWLYILLTVMFTVVLASCEVTKDVEHEENNPPVIEQPVNVVNESETEENPAEDATAAETEEETGTLLYRFVGNINENTVFYGTPSSAMYIPDEAISQIRNGMGEYVGIYTFGKSVICEIDLLIEYLQEYQNTIRSCFAAIDTNDITVIDKSTYLENISNVMAMFDVYAKNGDGTDYHIQIYPYTDKTHVLIKTIAYTIGAEYCIAEYSEDAYDALFVTNMYQESRVSTDPVDNTAYYTLYGSDEVKTQNRWRNAIIVNLIDGPVACDKVAENQDVDFDNYDARVEIAGDEYFVSTEQGLIFYDGVAYQNEYAFDLSLYLK